MSTESSWHVYIVQCADGTFYTGCAKDLQKRILTHNKGEGAKYTRARLPVALIFSEVCVDHSAALKREIAIKKLSRDQKKKLIYQYFLNLSK